MENNITCSIVKSILHTMLNQKEINETEYQQIYEKFVKHYERLSSNG